MIFVEPRDPRFITVRRGGTLSDANHRLLAVWAATCAEHVCHFFEEALPGDDRLRHAIAQNHAWVRGEITMRQALKAAAARAAARDVSGAARHAAYATAQAVAVAHVPAHALGAAAYAIRPRRRQPTPPNGNRPAAGNANGNANNCRTKSARWCWMTNGCAIMPAGSCSTAEGEPDQRLS